MELRQVSECRKRNAGVFGVSLLMVALVITLCGRCAKTRQLHYTDGKTAVTERAAGNRIGVGRKVDVCGAK